MALPHNSYVIEVFHSQWCQVAVLLLCCDEGKQVIQLILKCHCYLRAPSLEMTLLHLVVSASSVRLLGNLERGNSSKSSGSWFSSDRLLWNELWRVSCFYRIPPRQPSRAWVSFPRWKESWDLMTRPFEKLACRLESRVNQLTKQICTKAFTWRRLKSQKQSAKIFFSFSRSLRFLSSVLPLIFAINQIDW